MSETFEIAPVGYIKKTIDETRIEIDKTYLDALAGLARFSHIHVLYWFHENDSPQKRAVLKVHPRGDKKNPLTGVFATHSPLRPNPIALTLCRIESIQANIIYIDKIDAFDGSPVIDIKCHIPENKPLARLHVPDWV